jgi:hypothetical protein
VACAGAPNIAREALRWSGVSFSFVVFVQTACAGPSRRGPLPLIRRAGLASACTREPVESSHRCEDGDSRGGLFCRLGLRV